MLTQDDFMAPSMGGERPLRRSSWKAEAIRRGNLKISGPIPITEDVPLNDEEEKQHAQTHSLNISPPVPDASSPQPAQVSSPPDPPSNRNESGGAIHSLPTQLAGQSRFKEDTQALEHKSPSPDPKDNSIRGESTPEPATHSPTPFPSMPNTPSKSTPKKKRKSGLRNVIRMIFGRGSREIAEPARQQETPTARQGHNHHQSEPVTVHESPALSNNKASHPRVSDLQVRELEPINPLGLHLPFPMNVNAPQDASPPHEYLTFEAPTRPERRRASLPSLELSQQAARTLTAAIVSNRLTPFDEQQRDEEPAQSPQIGIALSGPPHTISSLQSKRRSRSAGALRDLAKAQPSLERRRSDEIRYWRNSVQSGSIYSTATPRPRTAETTRTADTVEVPEEVPELVTESNDASPTVAQHDQDISEIPLPLEVISFDFGNLKNGFSDSEHDEPEIRAPELELPDLEVPELEMPELTMPEPKVPEPEPEVPARSHRRLSIEDRVRYLEDHLRDLEGSVRRISGRSNRQTIILENAPKGRRSRNRSSSATSDHRGSSRSKSTNRTISVTHEDPSPTSPLQAPLTAVHKFPSSTNKDKPLSFIDITSSAPPRPTTSPQPHTDLLQQFAKIYAMLKHERAAHKALERQVDLLHREIRDLHSYINYKLSTTNVASKGPSYPTPSPDALTTAHEDAHVETPRASSRPDLLDVESDDERLGSGGNRVRDTRETIVSRFSKSDSEGGHDDYIGVEDDDNDEDGDGIRGRRGESKEDIASPDVWATPKEESGFANGFFNKRGSGGGEADFF